MWLVIKQLLTFVEVNMFVCRPENPILWIFRYANKHIDRKQKSIIVLLYNAII